LFLGVWAAWLLASRLVSFACPLLGAAAALIAGLARPLAGGLIGSLAGRRLAFSLFTGAAGAFVGGLVLAGAAGALARRLLSAALLASAGPVATLLSLGIGLVLALGRGGRLLIVLRLTFGALLGELLGRLLLLGGVGRSLRAAGLVPLA
jgi:hypothetical protein